MLAWRLRWNCNGTHCSSGAVCSSMLVTRRLRLLVIVCKVDVDKAREEDNEKRDAAPEVLGMSPSQY
eukprot:6484901-Amphidinium_carterae.2